MRRAKQLRFGAAAALVLFTPVAGRAQLERLVIGRGGMGWTSVAEMISGLEDTTAGGSLQPRELDPEENILRGPLTEKGEFTNIFGKVWALDQLGTGMAEFDVGVDPRIYGRYSQIPPAIFDGDSTVAVGVFIDIYSIDLALPLAVNRVVFYPPTKGRAPALGADYTKSPGREREVRPLQPGVLLKDQFPQGYEISAALDPEQHQIFGSYVEGPYAILLAETLYNTERIANVMFPGQVVRFLRAYFPLGGMISELEVYGEGFPAAAQYRSQVIDIGRPVNFGRILWGFSGYRKEGVDVPARPDREAPVRLSVETRTGTDDTPLAYHVITEIGKEREVPRSEWAYAAQTRTPVPGGKGSVSDDLDHWSFWSSPYHSSGSPMQSPDGRRYVQIRLLIESSDIFAYGRLDSIAIEYAPLLAARVVAEVALREEPEPPHGLVQVPLGEAAEFTYDIRAEFSAAAEPGFDAVRLTLPSGSSFVGMQMGDPLVPAAPDSVRHEGDELVIYFPSMRITQADNQPIRVVFRAAVFDFSTPFFGEVLDTSGENLPQSIDPGDASSAVSTDGIQVYAPFEELQVLSPLEVEPSVLTPNGDGRNDRASLSFTLFGTDAGEVDVGVYDLGGRRIRTLMSGPGRKGRHTVEWDGVSDGGSAVPPGIYLIKASVETDAGTSVRMHCMAVAY